MEEEVKKHMLAELEEKAQRLSKKLSNIPDEEIVMLIRRDRESR